MWSEQVRATTFSKLYGNTTVINNLKGLIESLQMSNISDIPNILLYGVEGTGKTSSGNIIASMLTSIDKDILIINGSMDGNKETLKTTISDFCKSKSLTKTRKIVIIDECDNMTKPAQHGFRKDMEELRRNNNLLFILICNYVENIIGPIRSRTADYMFTALTKNEMFSFYDNELKNKFKVMLEQDVFDVLYQLSSGFPRKFVNLLQQYSINGTKKITMDSLQEAFNDDMFEKLINMFNKKENIKDIFEFMNDILVKHSINERRFGRKFMEYIIYANIDDDVKNKYLKICGEFDYRLVSGATPTIQLIWLITNMM